jgi:Ca-activated chloride channel homolog
MKRWICVSLLLILTLPINPAFAAGFIVVDEAHWWPGPPGPGPFPPHPLPRHPIRPWPPEVIIPTPRHHVFSPLELNEVKVHTRITDQVALTSVDQKFYNPNSTRLEGTFVFPVPKGAHLDRFSMEIDGKQVEAELLSANKARAIYEDIVRKAKDPALLEYAGRDIFKVRIFPIEPHSNKRIKISYTQLLNSDNGLVSYSLPLNTEKYSSKPVKEMSVKVDLESKRPLKSIYSPSHKVEIKRHGGDKATVSWEGAKASADADFALYFAPEKDEIGVNLLTYREAGVDGYFLLLASPGMDIKEKQIVPKDVVFVLDTSGSMAGKKLEQAKKALHFCVNNLNENDRFEIIRFSTEVEPLFDRLVSANEANIPKAEAFIKDLRAAGGTAIDDALRKAMAAGADKDIDGRSAVKNHERSFVIVFLTDGMPTVGTTDEDQIVAAVKRDSGTRDSSASQGTRVFCFGIGTDVNTHLLDRISEETRAASQYVLPEEDIEVKVSSFFAKIKDPVLANPEIKFSGDVHVKNPYPSPLPDLFKGEQVVLVGRYSGNGSSAITTHGTVNGQHKSFTSEANFPKESSENEFLPRLWATRRVGYLLDEIRLHGDNSELRDEVTELARKYGIVTPYAAYLIVEDESRREVPAANRSFGNFDKDGEARQETEASWYRFKTDRDGSRAVATSRMSMELKSASGPALGGGSDTLQFRRSLGLEDTATVGGIIGGKPSAVASPQAKSLERVAQYAEQTQFAGGKNFFQNDNQWVDSEVQAHPKAKRVTLEFGSPEYYDLVAKHPEAGAWLALGQNVQFVLGEVIYEVREQR